MCFRALLTLHTLFLMEFVALIAEVSMPARLRASVAAAVRVVGMGVRCLIGGPLHCRRARVDLSDNPVFVEPTK